MIRQACFDVQSLENRQLLSVTPAPTTVPISTIQQDRVAVQSAEHKLVTDARSGKKTIKSDSQAIKDELQALANKIGRKTIDSALAPLKKKLKTDTRAGKKALLTAEKALGKEKRLDLKIIHADTVALRDARRSGDQSTIDAATKTLAADKAKMQTDLKPLRDAIIAVGDKWKPILTADAEAITAKLESLDPTLTGLFDKLESDGNALASKLSADQTTIADALKKLQADVLALEHAPSSSAA